MRFIKKFEPLIKFILTLLLFFYSSLIQFLPLAIMAFFDKDFSINLNDPNIVYALQIFSNSVLAFLLFLMYKDDLIKEFKTFKKNFWDISDKAIKYWILGLIVMAVSNILISKFTPVQISNNEQGVREIITGAPILAFLLTTVLAPFTEEIIFRKSFRTIINEKIPYILISGLIFGALHVVTDITSIYDYLFLIPYCALGISFSYINYETKNIFSTILVHTLHNGILTMFSIIGTGMIL